MANRILQHVRLGDFTLSSGQQSPVLFDIQGMLTDPQNRVDILRDLTADLDRDQLRFHDPDCDIATTYVGVELGGALLALMLAEQLKAMYGIYRKSGELILPVRVKQWLTEPSDSDPFMMGPRCVLVEDVITTGASISNAWDALVNAGFNPDRIKVLAVIDRRELTDGADDRPAGDQSNGVH